MKIFWITKLSDKNPFKATQLGISDGLRKRGHEVTLVMIKNISEKKSSTKDILYLPTIDSPMLSGLIFGLIILFYFSFFIKREKVDVVFFDGDQIWSPFALTLKMLRVSVIWDIRSLPIDRERSILHDISFYLTRYLVDGLTTITPELSNILKKKYRLHDKKIGIWSSGVSMEHFHQSGTDKTIKNGYAHENFILIHHGTYSPTRGIEDLIGSIRELDDSLREKIKIMLVGIPLNKKMDLLRLCEELGVEEQIDIIPPVDQKEIPSYIQLSDVGVIPLPPNNKWWQVSVPLKTLEYLAMSKPIIATDIPFHKRIFDKCECGVLIDSSAPKTLGNAITYLYEKRDELSKMGKRGRELVENDYTWDKKALELENFIKNVLEKY